jgi:hydrogenase small subunit
MTAATQSSIEDIPLGGIPRIPKVCLHSPFLTFDNGEEFMRHFHQAAEGKLGPFILVMEGSIPNEKNKSKGYWATLAKISLTAMRANRRSSRAATLDDLVR